MGPYTTPNYNQFMRPTRNGLMLHSLNGPGLPADLGELTLSQWFIERLGQFSRHAGLEAIDGNNTSTAAPLLRPDGG